MRGVGAMGRWKVSRGGALGQFRERPMRSEQVLRTAGQVIQGRLVGDPEESVKRRMDFAEMDGAVGDFGAQPVGGTNDLAGTKSTTG